MNYFDPKVLSGIKNLYLRARYVVDGVMVGQHTSLAKGLSSEFEGRKRPDRLIRKIRAIEQGQDPQQVTDPDD